MVLIDFSLYQPIHMEDIEETKLLYNTDVCADFKVFSDFFRLEILYQYIKQSKNYLIKQSAPLLLKKEKEMIEEEKQIESILLKMDANLNNLLIMRNTIDNFNGDLKTIINTQINLIYQEEDEEMLEIIRKINFFKEKMEIFIGHEDIFTNFLKSNKIFDDIICFSVDVVL